MTNNLLPFDPLKAKSWANPDGLDVVDANTGETKLFIGISPCGDVYCIGKVYHHEGVRLRPRTVKRVVSLFHGIGGPDIIGTFRHNMQSAESDKKDEDYITTIEIEVPEESA